MGYPAGQPTRAQVWQVAERQHDRITYDQLIGLGFTPGMVHHRVEAGRLMWVAEGLYATSRPRGSREERWTEATLRTGLESALSHESSAAYWRLDDHEGPVTQVSVPLSVHRRPPGLRVHRRSAVLPAERRQPDLIPVTSPELTLIDNANRWGAHRLEAAINKTDGLRIARPDDVRATAERYPRVPGASLVRLVLDRLAFELTDSELERMFRRILARAGLPQPLTQQWLNGYRVDFHWPGLSLIVETDSLRYHRTPSQQGRDRRRDQIQAAAGLETVRFTHWDVAHDAVHVKLTLYKVIARRTELATIWSGGR